MLPSISPSSIEPSHQWVIRISKTFETHLLVDTDLPICIFHVPETLINENRESFVPKRIGLGPIHHFHTELYSNQEQLKLTTSKTVLTPYKTASHFTKTVIENLKQLVPEVRCCYDSYFDVDDDTLAWVFALDGVFLIDMLSKLSEQDSLESFEDIVMVENQIPLIVLIEIRTALEEHISGHCNNTFLANLLFLRTNFLDDVDLEDVENAVQMASEICPGASAFLQPLMIVLKLPWDKIINLIKKMLGENPAVLEIDIPSASELSRIGKIEFCMTPGGIRDVEFDDETTTFYLPILCLKPDSEVVLRNLVVYEGLMLKKGTFTNLDFTQYVDLMCGIIDSAKDVRVLREKHIIEGDLEDDEIVKIFNGISKSSMKTEEVSGLQKTVERVNKYYGNVPRVKVYYFMKKYFLAWWKAIAIVFTLLNLMLLVVRGACEVYECNNSLGFGFVRLIFSVGTERDGLVEFERI
ncbi:hypothetical protein L1987_54196 [Smallanthus sonchifolius]|uniref:Uncharacterized protein n=1 Tax=Smallanthus sonchifolius TaxID=185202 RepID=A0ACB9E757_9ASTR|nr:hypothetical protein L1987_54196 [Smallanthus sonchifolius]